VVTEAEVKKAQAVPNAKGKKVRRRRKRKKAQEKNNNDHSLECLPSACKKLKNIKTHKPLASLLQNNLTPPPIQSTIATGAFPTLELGFGRMMDPVAVNGPCSLLPPSKPMTAPTQCVDLTVWAALDDNSTTAKPMAKAAQKGKKLPVVNLSSAFDANLILPSCANGSVLSKEQYDLMRAAPSQLSKESSVSAQTACLPKNAGPAGLPDASNIPNLASPTGEFGFLCDPFGESLKPSLKPSAAMQTQGLIGDKLDTSIGSSNPTTDVETWLDDLLVPTESEDIFAGLMTGDNHGLMDDLLVGIN